MYLVELRPGKEELYRSVEELAAAIRSGDVDAHSRIFHRAAAKWISVTVHPQFRAIAAARESDTASAPGKEWTFLTSAADALDGGRADAPMMGGSASAPDPAASEPAVPSMTEKHGARSWRRPFTLGALGVLFAVGIAVSMSRREVPETGDMTADAGHDSRLAAGSARTDSMTVVAYPVVTEAPAVPVPVPARVVVPPAPVVQVAALETPVSASGGEVVPDSTTTQTPQE